VKQKKKVWTTFFFLLSSFKIHAYGELEIELGREVLAGGGFVK
jgi:hypothetical protein